MKPTTFSPASKPKSLSTRTQAYRTTKKGSNERDPKKELIFKWLCGEFATAGIAVRREKLKTGPGWKVVSGTCRLLDKKYVFVDPKLTQDDQILFLRSRADILGVALNNDPSFSSSEGEKTEVEAAGETIAAPVEHAA